jgi:hypothetical protein
MAWNRQELTKEDLQKAGLDPDKLAEFQAKGVTKDELTAMETRIGTSVAETIKNSLADLETRLRTPTRKEGDDQQNQEEKPDDQTAFITDPVGYVKNLVGQSVTYSAANNTKLRMDLALDRAKATLRGFKNKALSDEIEAEWKLYNPAEMGLKKDFDPDKLIKKIHDSIIGAHMEEIEHDTAKREGKFNLVASGSGSGGGNAGPVGDTGNKKPEDQLTDVEKKQAARFGMTAEEWVKQNREMADEEANVMAGRG